MNSRFQEKCFPVHRQKIALAEAEKGLMQFLGPLILRVVKDVQIWVIKK